jgi:hypothetical protein
VWKTLPFRRATAQPDGVDATAVIRPSGCLLRDATGRSSRPSRLGVLRTVFLLAAFVSLALGLAPGAAARTVETRVGVFWANYDAAASGDPAQAVDLAPENCGCGYETASGQGLWLNRDPLEEEGSLNLYAYCHNDGVNFFDPDGLQESSSSPFGHGQPGYPKMQPSSRAPMEGDYQKFYDLTARVSFKVLHYTDPNPPSGQELMDRNYRKPGVSKTIINLKEPKLIIVRDVAIIALGPEFAEPPSVGDDPPPEAPADYVRRNSGAGRNGPVINTQKNLTRRTNNGSNIIDAVNSYMSKASDVETRLSEDNSIRILYVDCTAKSSSYWLAVKIQKGKQPTQFPSAASAIMAIHGYYFNAFYPIPNGF